MDVSRSEEQVTDKQGAIARPANRELDHEFDGFDDHIKDGDLAAARADLRAAVVTERRFDRQLIELSFPPRTEPLSACSTASTRRGPS
jgi:DNA-binding GntR family transcriptional regulator